MTLVKGVTVNTTPLTYSVAEAAAKLGIGKDTLRSRVQAKEWPCTRMMRNYRFTEENLTEILRLSQQQALAPIQRRRKAS